MAATSGTFNFVKLTKIEYADVDTSLSTAPDTLTEITAAEVLDGTFMLDIPEKSVTTQFNEDGEGVHSYGTPVQKTASMGLANATLATASNFIDGTFTAGTAGTTPDSISYDGTKAANKYVKVTGVNTEGQVVTVILYNARVTNAFTGAMGQGQALIPLTVKFYALRNKGMGKTYTIAPAF